MGSGTDASATVLTAKPRKRIIRTLVRSLLGETLIGLADYYRYPHLRSSWGGELNGQLYRRKMIEAFMRDLSLNAIVETGTYRGTTTAYLATVSSLPVYTVEYSRRFYSFSWLALRHLENVHRFNDDSRSFLRGLTLDNELCQKTTLFYLDAHWNAELPLAEELEIIFDHWNHAVVLIDDFQVIGDPGYGYDDYGPGAALNLEYIEPAVSKFGLAVFYPAVDSTGETGAKRGSVTLAAEGTLKGILRNMSELHEFNPHHTENSILRHGSAGYFV